MAFRLLPRTITFYRALRVQLSTHCVNDCLYCPFTGRPLSQLPAKKLVRGLTNKARRRGIHTMEIVSGERVWELDEIHSTLAYLGLPSFDDYVAMIQAQVDAVNAADGGMMFPVWNVGPLTSTETRLWRPSLLSVKLAVDPADPLLWREGPLRQSPRKTLPQRLKAIEVLGQACIPTTVVLNIGVGESAPFREKTLRILETIHQKYKHIQSLEVAPYKPRRLDAWEPEAIIRNEEIVEFLALARKTLPREIVLQIRPLNHLEILPQLIQAGVRDFGAFYYTDNESMNTHIDFVLAQLHKYLHRMNFRFKERIPLFDRFIERGWFPTAYLAPVTRFARMRRDRSLPPPAIRRAIPAGAASMP
ncbi:MAG: hypothetical protein Kow0059_18490 [Candidatus Sumerlaeia bacterium]